MSKVPYRLFRIPTPRQEIWRFIKWEENFGRKYGYSVTHHTCLCSFCKYIWYEQGYDDGDFGCNAERSHNYEDTDNFNSLERYHCAGFKAEKEYSKKIATYKVQTLERIVELLNPIGCSYTELVKAHRVLRETYEKLRMNNDSYIKKICGAEVLERMTK